MQLAAEEAEAAAMEQGREDQGEEEEHLNKSSVTLNHKSSLGLNKSSLQVLTFHPTETCQKLDKIKIDHL